MSHTHVDLEKDGDMVEIEGEKEFQSSAYVSQGPMVKEPKTKAEKSLLMKSDLIIVPLIALLYVVSYLVSFMWSSRNFHDSHSFWYVGSQQPWQRSPYGFTEIPPYHR